MPDEKTDQDCQTGQAVLESPAEEQVESFISDDSFIRDWSYLNGPQDSRLITCHNVWDRNYRVNWFGPANFNPISKSLFITIKGDGDDREIRVHENQ